MRTIDVVEKLNETWNNSLEYIFSDDFKEDIISIGVGFLGSEVTSIGAVIAMFGVVTFNPLIVFLGVGIAVIGEFGIAYSDGWFDGEITNWDVAFFLTDSVISWTLPFLGGSFKVASSLLKSALKTAIKDISALPLSIFKYLFKEAYLLSKKGPIKYLYDGSVSEQVRTWFMDNIVPLPFQEYLDKTYN